MMSFRAICFGITILLFVNHLGWLAAIPAVFAIFVPYGAVVFANGGREPDNVRGFMEYRPNRQNAAFCLVNRANRVTPANRANPARRIRLARRPRRAPRAPARDSTAFLTRPHAAKARLRRSPCAGQFSRDVLVIGS